MEEKTTPIKLDNRKSQQIEIRFKTPVAQKRKVKTWTPQQDELLFQLHQRYPKKWNKISQMMKNRNENQCLHRYRRLVQVGEHKKIWSSEEDQIVLQMVKKYGNNWKIIAATLKTKTGKQIRERYINKLDPSIKREEWTQQQDLKIIQLYTQFGSKWSEISKGLPGRPQNRIKNRFYSYIQKNYDILVKDEMGNTNELTGEQSSQNKSEMMEEKRPYSNFIYVPATRRESQSHEFQSQENKENKEKQVSERSQKIYFEKHFKVNSKKSIDQEWNKERSLQEINQPNQITYGCHHHGNQDLLYFEDN